MDYAKDMDLKISKFIGRRIAEYRLEKGMSQTDLSKAIGKESPTAISYLESGNRKIRIEDLIKVAQVLGKTVNDFLPQATTEHIKPKEFALKLRSNYSKLDKETEQSVVNFAELARKKFGKPK